jgi:hypothetical protein
MAEISHQASNEIQGWAEMKWLKHQSRQVMKWLKYRTRQAMKYRAGQK